MKHSTVKSEKKLSQSAARRQAHDFFRNSLSEVNFVFFLVIAGQSPVTRNHRVKQISAYEFTLNYLIDCIAKN